MSVNAALSERFALIAKMIDLLGEDSFRAIAHSRAARVIGDLAMDLEPIARAPDAKKQLTALDGVGPKIADKIIEFVATGKIAELEELRAKVPPGLMAVMEIPGLGPKTVSVFWNQAGVKSIADLKRIIEDGSILTLPRMGEKAVAKIKESIALTEQAGDGPKRLRLGLAVPIAERIIGRLEKIKGVKHAAFAGSARRGKETVGDIDILVSTTDPAAASKAFLAMPEVRQTIVAGESKSSVRFALKHDMGRWEDDSTDGAAEAATIQVDLRVIDESCWGSALMYFTGSKDHNVKLRERALKMGLTLNEYGLFPEDDEKEPPQKRGIKPVAAKTEADVYAKLGLEWVPPEMREDRGEIDAFARPVSEMLLATPTTAAAKKRGAKKAEPEEVLLAAVSPPRVIELADIKAELHAHTTASDGSMSIEELARQARQRGFHTIAVTDHSKSSAIAGGLTPLIELADRKNLRIMVDHTFLFSGSVRKIRELVDNGTLGPLLYFDSTRVNLGLFQHDVSVVWDLAPHDLSIMDHVIGQQPEAIVATGGNHFGELADMAYLTVYFPGNITAHINVNWLSPVKVRTTLIGGRDKMLVWNDLEPDEKIKVYDKGVEVKTGQGLYDLLVSYRSGDVWAPKVDSTEALRSELGYFLECILESKVPSNDGVAGLRVVRLLEAAEDSLKNRGRVVTL